MKRSIILLIDSMVNFVLGTFLLFFPHKFVEVFGLPSVEILFYPSIFGAVLIGIAIALFIEYRKKNNDPTGLGLKGAIAINLCGGFVLALWLIFGQLDIPIRGHIILWSLVVLLFILSIIELRLSFNKSKQEEK